jgi:hypothetical protein
MAAAKRKKRQLKIKRNEEVRDASSTEFLQERMV